MSKWNLSNHIVGKAYDLTQENMQAMIADIERLNEQLGVATGVMRMIKKYIAHNGDDWAQERVRWALGMIKGDGK